MSGLSKHAVCNMHVNDGSGMDLSPSFSLSPRSDLVEIAGVVPGDGSLGHTDRDSGSPIS